MKFDNESSDEHLANRRYRRAIVVLLKAHRSGEAIKPKTFDSKRDILAEAPVSLKNAWEPMEEFLASTLCSWLTRFCFTRFLLNTVFGNGPDSCLTRLFSPFTRFYSKSRYIRL